MAVNLSMLAGAGAQFFDNNGDPLTGGKIYTYAAGTTTPVTTYTTNAGTVAHANPIVLDAAGRVPSGGEIWLTDSTSYKFVLRTSNDVTIGTYDNIVGNSDGVLSSLSASNGSSLIGFIQSGTNAVPTTVQSKLRETVSVKDFGAIGSGDETAKIQAAVDATPVGGELSLEPGKTYNVSQINVTGKSICIVGYGATINCTASLSTSAGIYKSDHGNKLTVIGVTFTGSGAGIKHITTPSGTVYDELEINSCSFNMNSGVWSIFVNGGREPKIQNCAFQNTLSGNGLYFKDTVSPFVSTCIFKGTTYFGTAVYYPGTGNATDAGLVLRDCEVMGWDTGVSVVGCDWLNIEGCTIDYNTVSIKLGSQDGANISNNYIGSLGANPALWITYDAAGTAPDYCEKIIVVNNTFTGHYTGGNTYDCVLIDGTKSPDQVIIANNSFSFYTRSGIRFSLVNTRLTVEGNTFAQRTGFGVAPVYNALGASDDGVVINKNQFLNATTISAMNVSPVCRVNENYGCMTENRGETVAGSGVSTFNIAHGLSYTPAKSDILLTPTNDEAATKNPYIKSVDATNINVGFTTATTTTAGIAWRVRRYI